MKRPLMAAALLCVAILWIHLALGEDDYFPYRLDGLPAPEEGTEYVALGQICQIEGQKIRMRSVILFEPQDYNNSFPARYPSKTIQCKDKIIFTAEDTSALQIGMQVAVRGSITFFAAPGNPGEFDTRKYYRSLGICAELRKAELLAHDASCRKILQGAYRLRCILEERILTLMPGEEGEVMCALLFGDKSGLDRELKDLYKRNGILHILSISSLHITIIGMSLYRLLRKLRVPVIPAALAGASILLFYGAMTGFALSAVRAIGMYCLRMAAEIFGRTYDMLTALGVLAALMTLYRPYYLENAGFLLSFTAVFGVGVIYPILGHKEKERINPAEEERHRIRLYLRKIWEGIRESAAVSLSITLGTLPIQLLYYYEVPALGTVMNLLVLPLVRPLVICGICCLVPGLGMLSLPDIYILRYYEKLCLFFDRFALRTWNPGKPTFAQVLSYYLLLSGVLILFYRQQRRQEIVSKYVKAEPGGRDMTRKGSRDVLLPACKRFVSHLPGRFLAAASLILIFALPMGSRENVIFLDVGQGSCVLIRNEDGSACLYDCGSSSRSGVGRYILLPCLKYYGIRQLKAVIVSHSDNDHMNGVPELMKIAGDNGLTVGELVLSDIAVEERQERYEKLYEVFAEDEITYWSAGDSFADQQIRYTCLYPEAGHEGIETNDDSLCLLLEFVGGRILLCGDISAEAEGAVAEAYRLAADGDDRPLVLQVSHHGSRFSTSEAFLRALQPSAAVISVGKNNRYGHPHQETLERLETAGAAVFRTDHEGAVLIRTEKRRFQIRHYER